MSTEKTEKKILFCTSICIKIEKDIGALIDEINCDGCGICATCCPTQAIDIRYYRDQQLFAEITGLLGGE